MECKLTFDHFNINVSDIEKSIAFYKEALGLQPCGEINHPNGDFKIVYLKAEEGNFRLELTWLRNHPQPYELGENESHLALRVDKDYDKIHKYHSENGWVCFENPAMGIYFIHDPDDYWIEILPPKH